MFHCGDRTAFDEMWGKGDSEGDLPRVLLIADKNLCREGVGVGAVYAGSDDEDIPL